MGKKSRKRRRLDTLHNVLGSDDTEKHGDELNTEAVSESKARLTDYPFPVDVGDHCETPLEAYQDIAPALDIICKNTGRTKKSLRIYDPYFCQGAMKKHLASLGYPNVYNKKEDFYERLKDNALPPHDVLLTNPPYSKDHIKRILQHAAHSTAPAFLLLPGYVHNEPYYGSAVVKNCPNQPIFLLPWKRYAYWSPEGLRGRAMPVTPFESVWHLHPGTAMKKIVKNLRGETHGVRSNKLAQSVSELKEYMMKSPQVARTEKRPNPKARRRARAKITAARSGLKN